MESESAESEYGSEIVDSWFLIIYEKSADSGSQIRIAIPDNYKSCPSVRLLATFRVKRVFLGP